MTILAWLCRFNTAGVPNELCFTNLTLVLLSPAHRGREILVASGFCPASRFLVGAKTTGQFFFKNFNMAFLAAWGCASDFLKMLPKFKMATRIQLQKYLWAQKLNVRNYPNFTITFTTIIIEICRRLFQGFTAIHNDRHRTKIIFWWAQKK